MLGIVIDLAGLHAFIKAKLSPHLSRVHQFPFLSQLSPYCLKLKAESWKTFDRHSCLSGAVRHAPNQEVPAVARFWFVIV
jgi:hypothetical protein